MMNPINTSYLNRTVLSGYSQMNQMKYMLAMGGKGSANAVNPVRPTTGLSKENAEFIKDYQDKMTSMLAAAKDALNVKVDKLAASSQDSTVAQVSGKLNKDTDNYQVTVHQTAAGQVNRSEGISSNGAMPTMGGSLTISTANGDFHFNLSSAGVKNNQQALEKFAEKINTSSSKSGVKASVIQKDGKSYLELTGETGKDNAFSVTGSLASDLGVDKVASASRDASFSVVKNNGEDQGTYASGTNSVSVDGLNLTLKEEGTTEIKAGNTVTQASADAMEKLVNSFNSTLKFLNSNSDRGIGVLQQMKRMLTAPASESSMKMIGITANKDGSLSFDKEAFTKAMTTSPSFMKSITDQVASGIQRDAQQGLQAPSASLVNNNSSSSPSYGLSNYNYQIDQMQMVSTYNRTGVYNMKNYYAVGVMMNLFV